MLLTSLNVWAAFSLSFPTNPVNMLSLEVVDASRVVSDGVRGRAAILEPTKVL